MERKVTIITGAARGIGLATTQMLLEEGHAVVMVDRDVDVLNTEADQLNNVLALSLGVSVPE